MKITRKILEKIIKEEIVKVLAEAPSVHAGDVHSSPGIKPQTGLEDLDAEEATPDLRPRRQQIEDLQDQIKRAKTKEEKKRLQIKLRRLKAAPLGENRLQVARPGGSEPIRDQETLDSLITHLGASDRVHSPVQILEASGPYGIKDDRGNIAKQYMAYTIKLFFETDDSQKRKLSKQKD